MDYLIFSPFDCSVNSLFNIFWGNNFALPPGETHTYQRDDGTLSRELRGAEQRPDKAVDLLLLGVVLVVVGWDLRLLPDDM